MKFYHGIRTEHGCAVFVDDGLECRALNPRFDLQPNASNGFDWRVDSPGAMQLAFALAIDVLGDVRRARAACRALKSQLLCQLPDGEWYLTEHDIQARIALIERDRSRSR